MVLEGLGGFWVVMLDQRAYLASVWVILMVFGGQGGCLVIMLDWRAYLASV